MKYYVISDNNDTLIGLRLAGIEGEICRTGPEGDAAIQRVCADPEIGILMVTEKLAALCQEKLDPLKMDGAPPLIVEIPDRSSQGRAGDSITRYIQEAIGVKL